MVDQKDVILVKDVSETDQYDRLLRYVIVGDDFVNLEMVRDGFAQLQKHIHRISPVRTLFHQLRLKRVPLNWYVGSYTNARIISTENNHCDGEQKRRVG